LVFSSHCFIGAGQNCGLRHTIDMQDSAHHPNMIHKFRNRQLMRTN
jgi:hypothetical protein